MNVGAAGAAAVCGCCVIGAGGELVRGGVAGWGMRAIDASPFRRWEAEGITVVAVHDRRCEIPYALAILNLVSTRIPCQLQASWRGGVQGS